MKIVVYTALIGNHDKLESFRNNRDIDFFCFTDDHNLKSQDYKVIKIPKTRSKSVIIARSFKYTPHLLFPNYDYSIWIDARMMLITNNIMELVEKSLRKTNFSVFKHSQRNTLKEEVEACIKYRKDNPYIINQQANKYIAKGLPKDQPLVETTSLIRRHNESDVINFNEQMLNELKNNSSRDQIAFPYIAWKLKLNYSYIRGYANNSTDYKWMARKTAVDVPRKSIGRIIEYLKK